MTGPVLSGGHYRLGERLDPAPAEDGADGADGAVAVHHAHDTWEDRAVLAVSMPAAGGARLTTSDLTRVARDVRRAEAADHPGLVAALDVAVDTERGLWVVHAVPQGARTLRAARSDPPTPATVLRWALDLAGALVAAHAARLVHGRVAPETVIVDARGAAHLLAAPSGLRPDDRPGAEDADARALAAVLRTALPEPGSDPDPDGERLSALLDAVAAGHAPADGDTDRPGDGTPGVLTPALEAALRRRHGPVPVADPSPEDHAADPSPEDHAADHATRKLASAGAPEDAVPHDATPAGATAVVPVGGGRDADDRTTATVVRPPAGPSPDTTTRVVLPATAARTAVVPTGPARPVTPSLTTPRAAPWPPRAEPSWSTAHGPPSGVGPVAGAWAAAPAGPGGPSRRTVLVVLGVLLALALAAGVVLVALLGPSGRSAPNPTPGPSVTAPNGRVVPAVAVTPRGERSDTLGRLRRGGLEMAHTLVTVPIDRSTA